jgi:hypothetical protein
MRSSSSDLSHHKALQSPTSVPQTPIEFPTYKPEQSPTSATSTLKIGPAEPGSHSGLSGFFKRRKSTANLLDARNNTPTPVTSSGVSAAKSPNGPAKQSKSTLHELKRFLNHHIPHNHDHHQKRNNPNIGAPVNQSSTSASASATETTVHTPEDPHEVPANQMRGSDFDTAGLIPTTPAPPTPATEKQIELKPVPPIKEKESKLGLFARQANSTAPSPASSRRTSLLDVSSTAKSGALTPFDKPHGFASLSEATHAHMNKKYGKWGRTLGSGAGGTVRLIQASMKNGGAIYAVKEFRPKRQGESDKEYQKKVTAEFCVGSTLKHCNVIETVDIVSDHGHYYEVSPLEAISLISMLTHTFR